MKRILKLTAIILSVILVVAGAVIAVSAADTNGEDSSKATGFIYTHKTTGAEAYTPDLQEAFDNVKGGTTIYLNNPENDTYVYEMPEGYLHLGYYLKDGSLANHGDGNYVLDLCGNTLIFIQRDHNSYISLGSASTLTVKNGEIRTGVKTKEVTKYAVNYFDSFTGNVVTSQTTQDGNHTITMPSSVQATLVAGGKSTTIDVSITSNPLTYKTTANGADKTAKITLTSEIDPKTLAYTVTEYDASAFPIFKLNWGQVKLFLENVNTVTGGVAVLDGGQANGAEMKVTGGNHYLVTKPVSVNNWTTGEAYSYGAFIDTRSNVIFSANGANFYVDKDCTLVSSASYAKTGDPDKFYDSASVFTFKNCNITADYINTNLVKYANNVTKINFNACNIYGSIDPSVMAADLEKNEAMKNSTDSAGNPSYVNDEVFTACPAENIRFNHGTAWASVGTALTEASGAGALTTDGKNGEAYSVGGTTVGKITAQPDEYYGAWGTSWVQATKMEIEATITNFYGFKQVWTQNTSVTHTTEQNQTATLKVSYPSSYYQGNASINDVSISYVWSSVPTDNDVISGTNGDYTFTGSAKNYVFDKQIKIKDAFEITDSNGTRLVSYDEESPLKTALTTVASGGTVKFLADFRWITEPGDTYITVTNGLTIDINGYKFLVEQTPRESDNLAQGDIVINTTETVTLKDSVGTGLVAVQHANKNECYPLFRHSTSNSYHLVLENITGYGSMLYSYLGAGKVEIKGGTHYAMMKVTGSTGGYIATRDDIDLVATDATFFVGGGTASCSIFGAASKGSSDNANSKAKLNFTYNNCDIIATREVPVNYGDAEIFEYFNEFTQVNFNNCRVYGMMTRYLLFSQDSTVGINGADATSVRIGNGTLLSKAYVEQSQSNEASKDVVVPTRGIFVDTAAQTRTYTFSLPYGENYIHNDYQTVDYKVTVTFDYTVDTKKVFEVLSPSGEFLGYIEEDVELGVSTDGKKTLNLAVKELFEKYDVDGDNSTAYTIRFLGDYTVDPTNPDEFANYKGAVITDKGQNVNVSSSFNIDLNGYVITAVQQITDCISNKEQSLFWVDKSGVTVTVSNGQINALHLNDNKSTYPLFFYNVDGSKVVLNDLTVYAGSLVYAWGATVDLEINGGTYNAIKGAMGVWCNAFISIRNSSTVKATGATFYNASSFGESNLFSSSGRTEDISKSMKSEWIFTDCNITSEVKPGTTQLKDMIHSSNGSTTWYFNGCTILASINPRLSDNGDVAANNPAKDHSIIMGFNGSTATLWASEKRVADSKGNITVTANATIVEALIGTPDGYGVSYDELNPQLVAVYKLTSSGADGFLAKKEYAQISFNRSLGEGVAVNWYTYDSLEPIATTFVMIGKPAIPPRATLVDIAKGENMWYTVDYTDGAWATTPFGQAASLTVTGEGMSFYPVVNVGAWLKAATYNLSLLGNISANLLLPTESVPAAIEGIKVTDANGAVISAISATVANGKTDITYVNYDMYEAGSVDATALSGKIVVNVTFDVNFGGFKKSVTQKITISPLNYAKTILADESGAYDEAKAMIANMLRYSETLMSYVGTTDSEVSALYNQYSNLCTECDVDSFAAAGDYEALSAGIESISYVIDNYQLKLRLVLKSGYSVSSITLEGWSKGSTEYNWESGIECEYTTSGSTVLTANINVYNVDKVMTVTLNDGTTGTYSMNDYYSALDSMVTDGAISSEKCQSLKAFLEATRAYSESAAVYRFGPRADKQA